MADVEHSQLPDDLLHEPKGASTASAGTVYVADGAGSGSFEKLPTSSLNMTLEAVSLLTTDTTGLDILEEFKNKINELITALKNEGLIA